MATTKIHLHCAALSAILSLAGCSGGGGATTSTPVSTTSAPVTQTPPPTSAIPVSLQAPSTTVTYQAAAATATGTRNAISNVSISAVDQGATITLGTDTNGNLSRVVIPAGGIDVPVDGRCCSKGYSLADAGTLLAYSQIADPLSSTTIYNDTFGYSLSQAAAGQGLTSSTYGIWASTLKQFPAGTGTFAFGNLTPVASVPTTGSATFNGFTFGVGGASDGSGAYFLRGNAQIVANFATQSVTTNLTNFTTTNFNSLSTVNISLPNFTGTSTISGNGYTGPISGAGLSGTISGNFYGSAAQETAGVWQASGGGNAFIGSFGAK